MSCSPAIVILFLCLLPILSSGSQCFSACTDLTRQAGTGGTEVVLATVRLIQQSGVFTDDDGGFLRNIAFVETQDGTDETTYSSPDYHGGIWRVSEEMFNSVRTLNYELATAIHLYFGIDWSNGVAWTDLRRPLYSAIAARLYIDNLSANTSTVQQQAVVWAGQYSAENQTATYFLDRISAKQSDPIVIIQNDVQEITLSRFETFYGRISIPPETSVVQIDLVTISGSVDFFFSPVIPAPSSAMHCGRVLAAELLKRNFGESIVVSATHSPYPLSDVLYFTATGVFSNSSISLSYFSAGNGGVLPFLDISSYATTVDNEDYSNAITLPTPLPVGPFQPTEAYVVVNNGLISFGRIFSSHFLAKFPVVDGPVVGPYWSDIDSSRSPGHAVYALINDSDHTLVQQVNDFLSCHQNIDTELSWILVATWVNKCPDFDDTCTYEQPNTYQAVIGTDEKRSYSIFTYRCGSINWGRENPSGSPTVGYSADIGWFANHPYSQNCRITDIDCLNSPHSEWTNVVYDLTYNPVHCTHGDVVLAVTSRTGRGILGVCVDGEYSTVCTDTPSVPQLAAISCQLLGFDNYVSDSDRVVTSTAPIIIYYDCIDPTDLASCMFNLTSSDDQECVHGNDIDVRIQCDNYCPYLFKERDTIDIENITRLREDRERDESTDETTILTVEYCNKTNYVPVCRDSVGQVEAQLICTHRYGGSDGVVGSLLTIDILDTELAYGPAVVGINCPANATCVEECEVVMEDSDTGCSGHGGVAVISCFKAETCYEGQLRFRADYAELVDVRREIYTGRVEVCQGGEYVDVCSDGDIDIDIAELVCASQGSYFTSEIVPYDSRYGISDSGQYITNISCSHLPHSDINSCQYYQTNTCSSPLVVACSTVCGSGSARLLDQDNVVNNRNYNEIGLAQVVGVVEVCHNGEWASVCDTESINSNFANQVCVTLKYTYGDIVPNDGYGYSNSTVVVNETFCNEFGLDLSFCSYTESLESSCLSHNNDIAILCHSPVQEEFTCISGTFRHQSPAIIRPPPLPRREVPDFPLPPISPISVGIGTFDNETSFTIEALDICINNSFATICADSLDTATASLICSANGFSRGLPYPLYGSQDDFSLIFTQDIVYISCPPNALSIIDDCNATVDNYSTCHNYLITCIRSCLEGEVKFAGINGYSSVEEFAVIHTLVCVNGQFVPVCNSEDFTLEQARALCLTRFAFTYYTLPYPVYGSMSDYVPSGKFDNEVLSFTCPRDNGVGPRCSFSVTESSNSSLVCSEHGSNAVISCIHRYGLELVEQDGGDCMDGDIILTENITTASEVVGFVQVCSNGYYSPVCGNLSGPALSVLAKTACNNLGYVYSDSILQVGSVYRDYSPVINVNNIACDDSAQTLNNCTIGMGECSFNPDYYQYYGDGQYYYYYYHYYYYYSDYDFQDFLYVRCFDACPVNISEVSCPVGYEFDLRQCSCVIADICVAHPPCQNGGTCILEERESYRCSCPLYFTGNNCQGTSLFDISQCEGSASPVCKGRRLSAVCRTKELRGETLPDRCNELNNIK